MGFFLTKIFFNLKIEQRELSNRRTKKLLFNNICLFNIFILYNETRFNFKIENNL